MLILALIAFAVLAAITCYLAYLNWNMSLWTPIVSSIGVGLFTLFLTLALSLKEEKFDSVFGTTIVIDQDTKLPPLILMPQGKSEIRNRYMSYAMLARTPKNIGEKPEALIAPPKTTEEEFALCNELIQYNMVKDIPDLVRNTMGVEQLATDNGIRVRLLQRTPVITDDAIEIKEYGFLTNPSDCRFLSSEAGRFQWKMLNTKLPEGTTITLSHIPPSQETSADKRVITIAKRDFFTATITIEGQGAGTPGGLIAGVDIERESAKSFQTYAVRVKCSATFDRWTSGNRRTAGYKAWVKWLFSELEKSYKDE